jgi:hypothetical protein
MKRTSSKELQLAGQVPLPSKPKAARLRAKVKPTKGYAYAFHILLSAAFPLLLYVLVRMEFVQVAMVVVLLSKWRMFAVRPRFWPAIIRANAVDILVSLSTVIFMSQASAAWIQIFWTVLLVVWQVGLKPMKSTLGVSTQAFVGQTYSLVALYVAWPAAQLFVLVFATGAIAYLAARHFLTSFDEAYAPLYANVWGYFAAALAWVSAHWLLYYGAVAQPALLLSVLGFGLGGLYYLQESDKLSDYLRRQILIIMGAVVAVVFLFSDWGSKIV